MHNKFAQKQLNLFRQNIFFCWTLHLLTSFGIICSFFALKNIIDGEIFKAFMWLGLGLLIDGIDGTIARLLKVPERAHWKACVKSKEMETTIAESFKDKFKPFDQTAA